MQIVLVVEVAKAEGEKTSDILRYLGDLLWSDPKDRVGDVLGYTAQMSQSGKASSRAAQ